MKRARLALAAIAGIAALSALAFFPLRNPRSGAEPKQPTRSEKLQRALPVPRDRMGFPLLALLSNQQVQQELTLSEGQRLAIANLGDAYAAALADDTRQLMRLQGASAAPEAAVLAVHENQSRRLDECGRRAAELLHAEQLRRLDQILFQMRSVEAYEMPEIADALELTEQQRLELRKVRYDLQAAATKLAEERRAGRISRHEFDRGVGQALEHAAERAALVLNRRQREQVAVWRGKPISFNRQELRLAIRGKPRM